MAFYKLVITKRKGTDDEALQFSELNLYDRIGNKIQWNVANIQSNMSGFNNEGIENIVDGNNSTKFCTGGWGSALESRCEITIQVNDGMSLPAKYSYVTGNDSPNRDPVSWILSYSKNGTDYITISEVYDGIITDERNTETQLFNVIIKKYLIRDGSTLYTVTDGTIAVVEGELTSELFYESGTDEIPDGALLLPLESPEVLCWTNSDELPTLTATVHGTPKGKHEVISDNAYIWHPSIHGISSIVAVASDNAEIYLSFDGGEWVVYDTSSNTWISEAVGMTAAELVAVPESAWQTIAETVENMRIKAVIYGAETVTQVKFNFNNDAPT